MNHALTPALHAQVPAFAADRARQRRISSLLVLFGLYTVALLLIVILSDSDEIGATLVGIFGHVIYAAVRLVGTWREASWLEDVRTRLALAR
jgi:hypothetical protein